MGNSCDKVHIDDPPPYISDLQRLSRLDSIQLSNIKSNHSDFNLAQSILIKRNDMNSYNILHKLK